jgi:asparagine synthase (glutamine-hydrolysing)
MCGIAGAFGGRPPSSANIDAALKSMFRRGPDASGIYKSEPKQHQLTLLHSRLSILDLDKRADQPFQSDGCVLIFNGEIYNYLELKADLEIRGHSFRTNSDTEVIIKAYRQFGLNFVDHMEGMWAFALLDNRNASLILSRDRFGEKPLYYTHWGGTLYFASEVKAIAALAGRAPKPNDEQIRRYLVNGYKSLYKKPLTFFEDIQEFPTASTVVLDSPHMGKPKPYWTPTYAPTKMTREEAVEGVREHLFRALEIRLRADVPIAFCLSGGIDSTALASIAARHFDRKIETYSIIDEDERYNETENIRATVEELDCGHNFITTKKDGFLDRMKKLVAYHDAPVATISYFVHSTLLEAMSADGFKVALSGTGADELFTGYYDHYGFWLAMQQGRPDFQNLLDDWAGGMGTFVQNPFLKDPLVFAKNPFMRDHIYLNRDQFNSMLLNPVKEQFFEETYSSDLLRNRMINEIKNEVIPVLLREDDLNSMKSSVENRSPFLDRGLTDFCFSVPTEHLVQNGMLKSLLREAVSAIAPKQILQDKRKRGFNASIDSMINRNDSKTLEQLLEPGPIFDYVDRQSMESFLTGDMTDNSFSKFLFSFVSARLFLESDVLSTPVPDLTGRPEVAIP